MRIAIVDKSKCKPKQCNYLCIKVCPPQKNEIEVFKVNEEDKKPEINEVTCIGCGLCVKKCPFNAIRIVNTPEFLSNPLFRYGKNGFALFGLPLVKFGSIVGIIGSNGLGKSTSLEILAGLLKPNFGENKEFSYKEIKERLKGNEIYNYFDKLEKEVVKVSYKPQFIEKIPLMFKGKSVKELLKKYDENKEKKEIFDFLIEKLEVNYLLDRKIENLSGGELQRLAVLVCLLKNANVFLIDEPCSYLDIKQRINLAKLLNSLKKDENSFLVIEHDLLVLDYLSDYIHIFFGNKGVFGVVSNVKNTREGINEFLEGYLRAENIKIRDFEIKYEEKVHFENDKPEILLSIDNDKIKKGDFELLVKEAFIYKKEVVGIVGENGIGKTTFFNYLKEKYEKKIALKKQYLDPEREEFVFEYIGNLKDSYIKKIGDLLIKDLLEKQLCQLSGGELQRVEIVKTLNQEADIYLFDEPSAYLDVELRIKIAKLLREFVYLKDKTLMVVDHDLLLIDYLSDRLMVFTGEKGIRGETLGPMNVKEGMNVFLKHLNITVRRDPETKRPRINKEGSKLDRKQKEEGIYY